MDFLGFFTRLLVEILLILASYCLATLFLTHKTRLLVNWPIAGTLPSLLLNLSRLHDWCTHILSRTNGGTLVLKGPWFTTRDTLLTCNPDNLHHILITNFTNFPKGPEYSEMFDLLGDGIFNADSESWRHQRQMAHTHLNACVFRRHLAKTSGEMVEKKLMPILASIAREGEVVDLQDVLIRFTFDSACALVFGVEANSMGSATSTPFGRAVDDAQEMIFNRYIVPGKIWKLLKRFKIGKERTLAEARVTIDNFIAHCISNRREELIRKRRDRAEQGSDLLTCYMESSELEHNKDDKFLRDTTLNLFIAGRDTTSAALTWFFWLVSKNPKVEIKIVEEIRSKLQKENNDEVNMVVSESGFLGGLVYLHAALCESLRLYPALPLDQKGVEHEVVLPSGHVVRPGMLVVYSIYAMGRMKWIWGEDCEEFKPERWITSKGQLRIEHPCKFLAFNAGPRTCLGKDIALTQMKAVAAAVIYNFHVQVLEDHPVLPKNSIMLFMKHGLMVRLRERKREGGSEGDVCM